MNQIEDIIISLFNQLIERSFNVKSNAATSSSGGVSFKKQINSSSIIKGGFVSLSQDLFIGNTFKTGMIPANEIKMILQIINELKDYNMFFETNSTTR